MRHFQSPGCWGVSFPALSSVTLGFLAAWWLAQRSLEHIKHLYSRTSNMFSSCHGGILEPNTQTSMALERLTSLLYPTLISRVLKIPTNNHLHWIHHHWMRALSSSSIFIPTFFLEELVSYVVSPENNKLNVWWWFFTRLFLDDKTN